MEKFSNILIKAGAALSITGFTFKSFTYTVDAGERAIIYDKFQGVKDEIFGEGLHFYIPIIQDPVIFEIRMLPKTIASQTGTKDLQTVDIALRVLHRPIPEHLPSIYLKFKKEYEKRLLPSIGNEVLKSTVAQYDADQLLQQREQISNQIKAALIARAKEYNIHLEDVSIIHIGFMKDYALAIEQKQVAQQRAERQRYIVQRDQEEKLAQIIRSEGEAKSAQLINESVLQYGAAQIEIKRLEAAKIIAQNLSQSHNITFVPGTGNGLLLNLRA